MGERRATPRRAEPCCSAAARGDVVQFFAHSILGAVCAHISEGGLLLRANSALKQEHSALAARVRFTALPHFFHSPPSTRRVRDRDQDQDILQRLGKATSQKK